jgi:hypothetical protein
VWNGTTILEAKLENQSGTNTGDEAAASATVAGVIELATDAESITGTATDRAVTPANLQAKVASATAKGIAELATTAETITGSDTARVITPAGLHGALAGLTDATITASDTIIFADVGSSNALKEDTVQGILDLASGGGICAQVVNTQTGAVATGSTLLPSDNTIPQITEGDEYMTLAITPGDSSNILVINVVWFGASSNANEMTAALFQDTTANALAGQQMYQDVGSGQIILNFTYKMTAGTTSSTTFRVRAGQQSPGTTTFNGTGGNRKLGGVGSSSITIMEFTT